MSASRRSRPRSAAGLSAFGRSLGWFIGLSAGAVVTAALLVTFQEWLLALFTSVGWGFAGLGLFRGLLPESDRRAVWVGFLGFFLVSAAGIVTASLEEYPLLGWTARNIAVNEAPAQAFANSYTFTDGQTLPRIEGRHTFTSRYGAPLGIVYVVPVVPDHWQAGQLIHVWAVARDDTYAADAAEWATPARAGVRLVDSAYGDDYRQAVRYAEQVYGVTAAGNVVFIRWTAAPEAELGQAWLKLLVILAGTAGLWLVGLIGVAVWRFFKP